MPWGIIIGPAVIFMLFGFVSGIRAYKKAVKNEANLKP